MNLGRREVEERRGDYMCVVPTVPNMAVSFCRGRCLTRTTCPLILYHHWHFVFSCFDIVSHLVSLCSGQLCSPTNCLTWTSIANLCHAIQAFKKQPAILKLRSRS